MSGFQPVFLIACNIGIGNTINEDRLKGVLRVMIVVLNICLK